MAEVECSNPSEPTTSFLEKRGRKTSSGFGVFPSIRAMYLRSSMSKNELMLISCSRALISIPVGGSPKGSFLLIRD